MFVSNPFCPCPEPVGYCESHERHEECEQHYEQTLGRAVVLRFSYGQLFERSGQVVGLWQCVVTPLAYYRAVLQQNQSGIAAYHRLQRGLVGVAERIFGSRQLAPTLYVLICRRREAEEVDTVLLSVFVYLVDVAEVAVVSHGKSGRNEQEGVTLLREHLLGDVLASVVRRNGEVVYRRFVALLGLHRLGVYILPCRVGVVVERELARHAVLAQYERAFELRLLGSFWYLHALLYVRSDAVRAEVEDRQRVETVDACHYDVRNGVIPNNPLVGARYEARHIRRSPCHKRRTCY